MDARGPSRRRLGVASVAICVAWALPAWAQPVVGVYTDKSQYLPQEPVTVCVTAYNPACLPMTLDFTSSLQASYNMDGLYDWKAGKAFLTVLTKVTILPADVHTWSFTHDADEYDLRPGLHSVFGEVVGYGYSDPFTFTVLPWPGNMNLDEAVDNQDINPFVLALSDLPTWQAQYSGKDILTVGDINGDGYFNNQDINPFVALLTGGGSAVPEPVTFSLVMLGGLGLLRRRAL